MKKIILCLALFIVVPSAAFAAGSDIIIESPEDTARVARHFGNVQKKRDTFGYPMLTVTGEGAPFTVYFYACDNSEKNCKSIQLWAYWPQSAVTLKKLNTWNAENRFGRAYLDRDGGANLEMDISMEHEMTEKALHKWFSIWTDVIATFEKTTL